MPPEPEKREEPKMNLQLRGDMTPAAVAQLIDKKEGIKSHPDLVASKMRRQQKEENQPTIEELKTLQGTRTDLE